MNSRTKAFGVYLAAVILFFAITPFVRMDRGVYFALATIVVLGGAKVAMVFTGDWEPS